MRNRYMAAEGWPFDHEALISAFLHLEEALNYSRVVASVRVILGWTYAMVGPSYAVDRELSAQADCMLLFESSLIPFPGFSSGLRLSYITAAAICL